MAIRIKARAGESTEGMLRRFKKMCEKEGLTKDIKRKAFFEKPSERARRSLRKSIKRTQMAEMGILPKGKKGMGGPGMREGRDGPGGPPVY